MQRWVQHGTAALRRGLASMRGGLGAGVVASTRSVHALTEIQPDYLSPSMFFKMLHDREIDFFTGVPDSLLRDFTSYVADFAPESNHLITANEGSAIGVAAGYHLATRRTPLVYLQNSGFGNTLSPLVALADERVGAFPMLVLVGWRGEPGRRDEPQHQIQGKVMPAMLSALNIGNEVLPDYVAGAEAVLNTAEHYMRTRNAPFVLMVKKNTFETYKLQTHVKPPKFDGKEVTLIRENVIDTILSNIEPNAVVVSTTGFTSREVFELRARNGQGHSRDFLTVGSMGHASAIAAGIATAQPNRPVYCIDGDGAFLMHMGNAATVGMRGLSNLKHVLINNGAHESVGGQGTGGFNVDFLQVARSVGYKSTARAVTEEETLGGVANLRNAAGPAMLEVVVRVGARRDLGRPTATPAQNKEDLMAFLKSE